LTENKLSFILWILKGVMKKITRQRITFLILT
jgi:hypothetical protein